MDPVTFLAISTATQVAGQVAAARATRAEGQAAYATAEYNASIRDRNAEVARNEAALRERVGERETRDFTSRYRALQAQASTRYRASGVIATTGTPLQVLLNSDTEAEEEKQMIGLAARTEAGRIRESGVNEELAGRLTLLEGAMQKRAAKIKSRSQMFSALSTAAFGGYRYGQIT